MFLVKKSMEEQEIRDLRDKGLTCGKLKSLENKEIKDSKKAYKDAGILRQYGFDNGAKSQEAIAKTSEQLADKLGALRKNVCGLGR